MGFVLLPVTAITEKTHKIHIQNAFRRLYWAFPAASGRSWSAGQYVCWNTSNNDDHRTITHLWVDEGRLEVTAYLSLLSVCIQKHQNRQQLPNSSWGHDLFIAKALWAAGACTHRPFLLSLRGSTSDKGREAWRHRSGFCAELADVPGHGSWTWMN